MYKIKRFSYLKSGLIGAGVGAASGLGLGTIAAGKELVKYPKLAAALGGLGAITGATIGISSEYEARRLAKEREDRKAHPEKYMDPDVKDVLNSKVLPNLPKEYDSLKRFAEGARKIEKMYYEPQDDWELYTYFYNPINIAESDDLTKRIAGEDYLVVLEFGMQDYLTFYYNIKDKYWYYISRLWQLNKKDPSLILQKASSFKKPILDLYKLTLEEFKGYNDDDFKDYMRYLEEMIKYVKSSNLK